MKILLIFGNKIPLFVYNPAISELLAKTPARAGSVLDHRVHYTAPDHMGNSAIKDEVEARTRRSKNCGVFLLVQQQKYCVRISVLTLEGHPLGGVPFCS